MDILREATKRRCKSIVVVLFRPNLVPSSGFRGSVILCSELAKVLMQNDGEVKRGLKEEYEKKRRRAKRVKICKCRELRRLDIIQTRILHSLECCTRRKDRVRVFVTKNIYKSVLCVYRFSLVYGECMRCH